MRRSFWLAVLAYLVPTFPLGYFWHLVTFADRYHQLDMYRDEVIIPLGLASMVIQALVFAWAYPRLFPVNRVPWQRGAIGFGCVFGVMAWSFVVLPVAAKYRMASVQDFIVLALMATSNSPTCGHSNSPRQDGRIMGFLPLSELTCEAAMPGAA